MNINSIGNGVKPYSSQQNNNDNVIGELQRQKDVLTKQLEAVKLKPKNNRAEQDAAEKQKAKLEKQIAAIEQKIQKASETKNGEAVISSQSTKTAQVTENSTQKKSYLTKIDELNAALKRNKSPFKATGNIIDVYV